jgi:hypothetical protein
MEMMRRTVMIMIMVVIEFMVFLVVKYSKYI